MKPMKCMIYVLLVFGCAAGTYSVELGRKNIAVEVFGADDRGFSLDISDHDAAILVDIFIPKLRDTFLKPGILKTADFPVSFEKHGLVYREGGDEWIYKGEQGKKVFEERVLEWCFGSEPYAREIRDVFRRGEVERIAIARRGPKATGFWDYEVMFQAKEYAYSFYALIDEGKPVFHGFYVIDSVMVRP